MASNSWNEKEKLLFYGSVPNLPNELNDKLYETTLVEGSHIARKAHDKWAIFLFLAHLIGFGAIAAVVLTKEDESEEGGPFLEKDERQILGQSLLVSLGFSSLITIFYFFAISFMGRALIIISYVLTILACLAFGILSIIAGQTGSGAFLIIVAVALSFLFCGGFSRFKFTAVLLQEAKKVLVHHPTSLFSSILVAIVQFLWSFLNIFVILKSPIAFGGSSLLGVIVFCLFSWYWTSQALLNILHTGIAGLFARFLLVPQPSFPESPVWDSFKSTFRYSLGQIFFGSLLIAILNLLQAIIRNLSSNRCLKCLLICCLSALESVVRFFNHYALVMVAIYGKPFCESGKMVSELLETRGLSIIVNENAVGSVFFIAGLFSGLGSFGLSFILTSSIEDQGTQLIIALVCCLFSVMVIYVLATVVHAGFTTILVCLGENPDAVYRHMTPLYVTVKETYEEIPLPTIESMAANPSN